MKSNIKILNELADKKKKLIEARDAARAVLATAKELSVDNASYYLGIIDSTTNDLITIERLAIKHYAALEREREVNREARLIGTIDEKKKERKNLLIGLDLHTLEALDLLVKNGLYKNRTAAIREILQKEVNV